MDFNIQLDKRTIYAPYFSSLKNYSSMPQIQDPIFMIRTKPEALGLLLYAAEI